MAGSFSDRIVGVLKLVPSTYREIARDKEAMSQAVTVVVAVAVASAIGGAGDGAKGIIGGAIGAVISWAIFGVATWWVGTNLMGATDIGGGPGRMLRTSGFGQAPQVLAVLGFIPVLGWIAVIVGSIWALITGVLAVRESLSVSTAKAIITAIVAAILIGIVGAILLAITGISFWALSS
jgi:hypothetical protein